MTDASQEAWEPVLAEGGLPHVGDVSSLFLSRGELASLDRHLEAQRRRAPIGFSPNQTGPVTS